MPGPLPDANARRRNAPTIPTTMLPASGRRGRIPNPPHPLGDAGLKWWRAAWRLPQACGWSAGDIPAVARRAALEDDIAALEDVRGLDVGEVADATVRELRAIIGKLAGMVGGKLSLFREARELDDRLGLTPKGLAALRWRIVPDAEPAAPAASAGVSSLADRRARIAAG